MKIKSLLVLAVFSAVIFCSAGLASAQSASVQALIAQLQAQIQQLLQQIAQFQQQQGNSTWCHTFNNNLKIGDNGQAGQEDVFALNDVLLKQGFDVDYTNSAPSGYFSEKTAAAVVKFQAKYGISQTGFVGPNTRARLNKLYGCGTTIQNIIINSTSGPNSLYVGQTGTWAVNATAPSGTSLTYSVDWGEMFYNNGVAGTGGLNSVQTKATFTHSYSQAGTYTVKFNVSDTFGHSAQNTVTVVVGGTVNNNLSITYPPDSVNWHDFAGESYSKTFSVVNSSTNRYYTWSITNGTLPSGLTITPAIYPSTCPLSMSPCNYPNVSYTMNIQGIPTQAGNFPFTLNVRDDLGNTGSINLNIYIEGNMRAMKPVIYLYPQRTQEVKVQLDYEGKIIADYPAYDYGIGGWNVISYPDGKIINNGDGKEYSYLFWEGSSYKDINYDLSTGFVVKGSDAREFLQSTLSKMGLTPKEYNEFIVFWYPKMENNAYNLVHFAGKEYTDTAKLAITPAPDSVLRVFMVLKPLDQAINIIPQDIKPFNRKGFAVVEWGGTELPK